MWPFKSKKADNCRLSPFELTVNELKAFRDIGQSFSYLGRRCIVTAHIRWLPYSRPIPTLQADYSDESGVIHQIGFWIGDLPALMAENP